jgi:hypothetical protein
MRTFCTLLFFIAATTLSAQNTEWLGQLFGEETYEQMLNEAPEKVAFYAFLDANGHTIEDIAPKPTEGYPNALDVAAKVEGAPALTAELIMSGEFHPQLYAFDRKMEESTWYRVGESSYLITFHPMRSVKRKYEDQ